MAQLDHIPQNIAHAIQAIGGYQPYSYESPQETSNKEDFEAGNWFYSICITNGVKLFKLCLDGNFQEVQGVDIYFLGFDFSKISEGSDDEPCVDFEGTGCLNSMGQWLKNHSFIRGTTP